MSHEVETMAYAGEVPWHGLGQKVTQDLSVDEMMEAAKLDWTVSQHPAFIEIGKKKIETGKYALVRDSDNSVLTVTSDRWKPTQNHEAFEFFREFCEVGGAQMETAGSLKHGRHVWALAKLNEGFSVNGSDRTEGYLLFSLPHEIGKSIQVRTTSVRVVCNNTLTWSLEGSTESEFRQTHARNFDFDQAKRVVEMAKDTLLKQAIFSDRLTKVKMDKFDAISFFNELIKDEALERAEAEGVLEAIETPRGQHSVLGRMTMGYLQGAGAENETAWGALQGVTYFCDHLNRKTQDARLESSWFGHGARMKDKALRKLEALAA